MCNYDTINAKLKIEIDVSYTRNMVCFTEAHLQFEAEQLHFRYKYNAKYEQNNIVFGHKFSMKGHKNI